MANNDYPKFGVGDYIICIRNTDWEDMLEIGKMYTVRHIGKNYVYLDEILNGYYFPPDYFTLLQKEDILLYVR